MSTTYQDHRSRLAAQKLAAESGLPPIHKKINPQNTYIPPHKLIPYPAQPRQSTQPTRTQQTKFQAPPLPNQSTKTRRPSINNVISSQHSSQSQQATHRPPSAHKRALPPVDANYDELSSQQSNFTANNLNNLHEFQLESNSDCPLDPSFRTPHFQKPTAENKHPHHRRAFETPHSSQLNTPSAARLSRSASHQSKHGKPKHQSSGAQTPHPPPHHRKSTRTSHPPLDSTTSSASSSSARKIQRLSLQTSTQPDLHCSLFPSTDDLEDENNQDDLNLGLVSDHTKQELEKRESKSESRRKESKSRLPPPQLLSNPPHSTSLSHAMQFQSQQRDLTKSHKASSHSSSTQRDLPTLASKPTNHLDRARAVGNDPYQTPPMHSRKKALPRLPPPPNPHFRLDHGHTHHSTHRKAQNNNDTATTSQNSSSSDESQPNILTHSTTIIPQSSNPALELSPNYDKNHPLASSSISRFGSFFANSRPISPGSLRNACIDTVSGHPASISYALKRTITNEFNPRALANSALDGLDGVDDCTDEYFLDIYNGDQKALNLYTRIWHNQSDLHTTPSFDPPLPLPLPPAPILSTSRFESTIVNQLQDPLTQFQSPSRSESAITAVHPPQYDVYSMECSPTQIGANGDHVDEFDLGHFEMEAPPLISLIAPPLAPFLHQSTPPSKRNESEHAQHQLTHQGDSAQQTTTRPDSISSHPLVQPAQTPLSDRQSVLDFAVTISKKHLQDTIITTTTATSSSSLRKQSAPPTSNHRHGTGHTDISAQNKKAITLRLKQYLCLFLAPTHPLYKSKYLNPAYHFFRLDPSFKEYTKIWEKELFSGPQLHQICLHAVTHVLLADATISLDQIHQTINHHSSYNK